VVFEGKIQLIGGITLDVTAGCFATTNLQDGSRIDSSLEIPICCDDRLTALPPVQLHRTSQQNANL
jgi:hypothetical protein